MKRKHLVISAVNLVEGGTLAILREGLRAARDHLGDAWRITAIVHRAAIVGIDGVEYLELPKIKRSWLSRIWFEYVDCRRISRELGADFWLSLHDMTPVVTGSPQAVYCHNAMCFHHLTWREVWLEPKLILFSSLYPFFYRVNLQSNTAVIVQQSWMRDEFVRRFGCRNVIVSHPVQTFTREPVVPRRTGERFFYPSLPRVFKNFETLLTAWTLLCADPAWRSELVITVDGSENRYARALLKRFGALRNVRFAGRLTPAQVVHEYNRSDCLVFPSKLETWGLPLTEAKQHGLAILAADLPYAHEAVGHYDAASFFPVDDADQLAQLLRSFSQGTLSFVPHRPAVIAPPFASDWASLFDQLLERPRLDPQVGLPAAAK